MLVYAEMGGIPETLFKSRRSDLAIEQPMIRFYSSAACGSCHILSPVIDSLAEKYQDVVSLIQLDVETDRAAAAEDQIDRTPTLIFSLGDKVLDRIEGPVGRKRIVDGFAILKAVTETT